MYLNGRPPEECRGPSASRRSSSGASGTLAAAWLEGPEPAAHKRLRLVSASAAGAAFQPAGGPRSRRPGGRWRRRSRAAARRVPRARGPRAQRGEGGEAVQGHASVSEPTDRRAAQSGSTTALPRNWMRGGEWAGQDSNLRPTDYESAALTAELPARGCGPRRLMLGPSRTAAGHRARRVGELRAHRGQQSGYVRRLDRRVGAQPPLVEHAANCPKRRGALQRTRPGGGLRAVDALVIEASDSARRQDHQPAHARRRPSATAGPPTARRAP
jgi:hypothetical protein